MRQVEEALRSHLREFSMLLGKQAALAVPEQLTEVRSGRDLALQDYDHLPLPDQVLLDTLAAQCAIAAQRAELQARTADIAEQLQSSLSASPLPALDRFDLAVHYAPGGDELEHVGGDWYDAVRTPNGTLALVVGDVMGRGVRAADHDDPGPRRDPRPAHRRPGSPGGHARRGRRDDDPRRARPVRDRRRGAGGPRDGSAHPLQRRPRAGRRGADRRHDRDARGRFGCSPGRPERPRPERGHVAGSSPGPCWSS